MEKIPCIECTSSLWEYIKPHLVEWGYEIRTTSDWETYPLLCINDCDNMGMCNNYWLISRKDYNRELVTNVEEFLERAAKLKGYTYKKKDIMEINGVKIKPGMVLIGKDWNDKEVVLVAFPTSYGIAFATIVSAYTTWTTNYTTQIRELHEIRDKTDSSSIRTGKLLWEKPKEIVITMDEIAKKFGYPVENIKIKK